MASYVYILTNARLMRLSCEKQLKGWLRRRKADLVETMNPGWLDLAADWYE